MTTETATVRPTGAGPSWPGGAANGLPVDYGTGPTVYVNDADRSSFRDIVRWGPIVAGVVTALAVMLFMTVLGLALGLSAIGQTNDLQTWGTAAGIWGGISALLSFFFGGWMAGRGSANGPDRNGVLNGFVTGATTLIVLIWLATSALTGALGFFASTITDLTSAAPAVVDVANQSGAPAGSTVQDAATNAGEAIDQAVPADPAAAAASAVESAGPGAWGTVIAIILAIGAAVLGGVAGQANRVFVTRPGSSIPA